MPDTLPEPDDDDALADAIADRIVELASRPGTLRLVACRMAGLIDEGSPDHRVARALGVRAYTPAAITRKAIQKLKHRHPELQQHLQSQP